MGPTKNEFTQVTGLRAEALGEPGKRTFRILVAGASSSAIIWLEKEQLFQLGLAIQRLMATVSGDQDGPTARLEDESPMPSNLDFKVFKLVLGHDAGNGHFVIDAHGEEDEDEETSTVRVWASSDIAREFSEEALHVCAAGRPLCPLCGGPIDPTGHSCPRVNGHTKVDRL